MSTANKLTITIDVETADDMMQRLSPRNEELWRGIPRHWVFRGQADASWPLLPSALRRGTSLTHHPRREQVPYPETHAQIGQEIEAVMMFVEEADYQGLPIPGVASEVMRRLRDDWYHSFERMDQWDRFPTVETVEAFALAQHHGVPTRLLDWSHHALTAAYFAASGAAEELNRRRNDGSDIASRRLGVWGLSVDVASRPSDLLREGVLFESPPRAPNLNLLAQKGLFSLHFHPLAPSEPTIAMPLDQALEKAFEPVGWPPIRSVEHPLVLLTLPIAQARKLLVLLADEEITAARLFPGYDGVVKELREQLHLRQTWRSPPEER